MNPVNTRRSPARTRGARANSSGTVLEQLTTSIDALVRENKSLKRQIARLEAKGVTAGTSASERTLLSIKRSVDRALDGGGRVSGGAGRQRAAAAQQTRTRRRITDPTILEARRQALARARQALAEKRAASKASSS
jgi:cell division septum initiation protein DivIVA